MITPEASCVIQIKSFLLSSVHWKQYELYSRLDPEIWIVKLGHQDNYKIEIFWSKVRQFCCLKHGYCKAKGI